MSGVDLAYLIGAIAAFTVFAISLAVVSHNERAHHRRMTGQEREADAPPGAHAARGAH